MHPTFADGYTVNNPTYLQKVAGAWIAHSVHSEFLPLFQWKTCTLNIAMLRLVALR